MGFDEERGPRNMDESIAQDSLHRVGAKTRKGRVCFLTSNFPRWDGDSTTPFVLHMAQDMVAEGWEVDVLAPHAPGAARQETLDGIDVYRFRYFRPERFQALCYQGGALINLRRNPLMWLQVPLLIAAEAGAMIRLARRRRYDLLHAHWIVPQGFVAVIVGWLTRIPVIVTIHGGDIFALRGRIFTVFKRFVLTHATAVTANSSETSRRARLIARRSLNVHRIPIGASEPEPRSRKAAEGIRDRFAASDTLLLMFLGRLVEEKGLGDLLEALSFLNDPSGRYVLLVLGDGQDRERFERTSDDLGLSGNVHFLGWVAPETVPDYLAAADIFAAPSKTGVDGWVEGQGLSIVEALLSNTPVIATRSGGIPDIVQHGVTGILVDEASPKCLAEALETLANDANLRRKLAEAGSEHATAHFTRAKSAEAFSELYLSVLKGAANVVGPVLR